MPSAKSQFAKLQFNLESFRENMRFMMRESREEVRKTLLSGASAYATSAAKHTPPNPGRVRIDPRFYADGVFYDRSSNSRAMGRRRVYDLLALARNPGTGHYRRHYGRLLRNGYYYLVSIRRHGKPLRQIPCKTEAEAARYAHETYRGLTRAAWGLSFSTLTGKIPPSFRKLLADRPRLSGMAALNAVKLDQNKNEVTNTNMAIKTGDSYLQSLDVNASIAAVKTMNDRMNKFFKKKYKL